MCDKQQARDKIKLNSECNKWLAWQKYLKKKKELIEKQEQFNKALSEIGVIKWIAKQLKATK